MDPTVEKILKRPKQEKIAILIVVLVLEAVAFYFPLYKPAQEKYSAAQTRLQQLQDEVRKDREIANNLPIYKQNYENLQKQLEAALTELPDQKEIPSLLTNIGHAGRAAGLDFLVFRPSGEIPKDFYAEVPVNISVSGSFHQVANFFVNVGNLSRIVNINNVAVSDIKKDPAGRTLFKVNCLATTFRFLDTKGKQ